MIDFRQYTSFCLGPSGEVPGAAKMDPIGVEWVCLVGAKSGMSYHIRAFEELNGETVDVPTIGAMLDMFPMIEQVKSFLDEECGAVVTYKRITPPIDLERFRG